MSGEAFHGDRATLLGLGADVLGLITDSIQESSPASLNAVCLAHPRLRNTARRSQVKHIKLKLLWKKEERALELLRALQNQNLEAAVQKLDVSCASGPDETKTFARTLVKLLPQLHGLRKLVWRGTAMPMDVLVMLRTCQQVKLDLHHAPNVGAWSPSHQYTLNPDDVLNNLAGLDTLSSLSVKHTYTSTEEALCVTRPLKRTLLECSNLRSLELDIGMPRQGKTSRCDDSNMTGADS
jgi:hypothetical protein